MKFAQRIFRIVADIMVKLIVIIILDLVLISGPDRLNGIERFSIERDLELNKIRIMFNDPFQFVIFEKLSRVLLEMKNHFGATRKIVDRFQLIAPCTLAGPAPSAFFT